MDRNLLGLFFLLRSSEYLVETHTDLNKRGLRGSDIEARSGGLPCASFAQADEVVLTIRGSKTDQLNRGQTRNHFCLAAGAVDCELCVVQALADLELLAPDRLGNGRRRNEPLLVLGNWAPLRRAEVQAALCRAAVAQGHDARHFGSRSLRFGGASAIWAVYRDSGMVRRWGRWASDAFHGYLWSGRKEAEGVAQGMIGADLTPAGA